MGAIKLTMACSYNTETHDNDDDALIISVQELLEQSGEEGKENDKGYQEAKPCVPVAPL